MRLIITQGDIKKLKNRPGYRLRVGDFRIIFIRDEDLYINYSNKSRQ